MTIDPKIHERLKEINTKLTDIEKHIHMTAVRFDAILQCELKNGIGGLLDFDLTTEIACYNDDDDAEPLCILDESLRNLSIPDKRVHFVNDGINHNEFYHWENHPMRGEIHCWLYHCLYDHVYLTWEQIASIETFWVDIKPVYQYQYEAK